MRNVGGLGSSKRNPLQRSMVLCEEAGRGALMVAPGARMWVGGYGCEQVPCWVKERGKMLSSTCGCSDNDG